MQQPTGLCKLESVEGVGSEVTRCIAIQPGSTWKVFVHGRELANSSSALQDIRDTLDPNSLRQLMTMLDNCHICQGNPDQRFVSLVEARNGSIKRQNGAMSAYLDKTLPVDGVSGGTVRTTECDLISSESKCASCAGYRKNLRAMVSSAKKLSSPVIQKRLATDSHTNYRYLRSPELRERLHNSKTENQKLSRKLDQFKSRLDKLTQSSGVTLDSSLHSDMQCIMHDHENDTMPHPPNSFARVFWEQQKESLQKNPKQMCWHPMMVKWCLHLRMLSSSCYNSLRSAEVSAWVD